VQGAGCKLQDAGFRLQGELIIELALLLILFTISVMNNNFVTELLQPANALMRNLMAIIQNSELKIVHRKHGFC